MNLLKVQTEIMKQMYSGKLDVNFVFGMDSDYVYASYNLYSLFKIRKFEFLLDLDKLSAKKQPLLNPTMLLQEPSDSKVAKKTRDLRVIGKTSAVKFVSESSYAWIDMKLLKDFEDKSSKLDFRISKPNAPVTVYECDEIIGLILPVMMKVEEGDVV